jgi:hypothetical protein
MKILKIFIIPYKRINIYLMEKLKRELKKLFKNL